MLDLILTANWDVSLVITSLEDEKNEKISDILSHTHKKAKIELSCLVALTPKPYR